MDKILVTGADGFVGNKLCQTLAAKGAHLRSAVRCLSGKSVTYHLDNNDIVDIKGIGPDTDWTSALDGVDTVVHLAARVHMVKEPAKEPLAAYRLVNTFGTERLAEMAVEAGVRRFIYISTIKVNGEGASASPLNEKSEVAPKLPYAISKLEAEVILQKISRKSGMELVIIRPPLVYGPEVGGNFLRMLNYVYKEVPLPFAGIINRRSMIGIDNLVDFIYICITNRHASGELFTVSDNEAVSTPELLRMLAAGLNKRAMLFYFPKNLLKLGACLSARSKDIERLISSLVIDSSKAGEKLGWKPPVSLNEGIVSVTKWYLCKRRVP